MSLCTQLLASEPRSGRQRNLICSIRTPCRAPAPQHWPQPGTQWVLAARPASQVTAGRDGTSSHHAVGPFLPTMGFLLALLGLLPSGQDTSSGKPSRSQNQPSPLAHTSRLPFQHIPQTSQDNSVQVIVLVSLPRSLLCPQDLGHSPEQQKAGLVNYHGF